MSSELNTGADWEQSKRLLIHWHNMWAKERQAYLKLQEELAEARRVIEWYSIMRHPVYQHKAREFLTKYPKKEG